MDEAKLARRRSPSPRPKTFGQRSARWISTRRPLRLQQTRAGLEPSLEPARRQGMGGRAARVRRQAGPPLLEERRVGDDEIGALGRRPGSPAASACRACPPRRPGPSTPIRRGSFGRQSSARSGSRSTRMRSRAPARAPRSSARPLRSPRPHPSPRRRGFTGARPPAAPHRFRRDVPWRAGAGARARRAGNPR